MTDKDIITTWSDLPTPYRKKYYDCALRYRASRTFSSDRAADQAAFEDVRKLYWDTLKTNQKKAPEPPKQGGMFTQD